MDFSGRNVRCVYSGKLTRLFIKKSVPPSSVRSVLRKQRYVGWKKKTRGAIRNAEELFGNLTVPPNKWLDVSSSSAWLVAFRKRCNFRFTQNVFSLRNIIVALLRVVYYHHIVVYCTLDFFSCSKLPFPENF